LQVEELLELVRGLMERELLVMSPQVQRIALAVAAEAAKDVTLDVDAEAVPRRRAVV